MSGASPTWNDPEDKKIRLECRREALKQLQAWSAGLITIQTAAIGAIGLWLQRDISGAAVGLSIAAVAAMIASISFGALGIGQTIPYCISTLPKSDPSKDDVWHYAGDGTWKWEIWKIARFQTSLFLLSVLFFALSALPWLATPAPRRPTEISGKKQVESASSSSKIESVGKTEHSSDATPAQKTKEAPNSEGNLKVAPTEKAEPPAKQGKGGL